MSPFSESGCGLGEFLQENQLFLSKIFKCVLVNYCLLLPYILAYKSLSRISRP